MLLPFSTGARPWETHGLTLRKRLNLSVHALLDPFKLAPLVGLHLLDLDEECARLPKNMRQQLLVQGKKHWSGGVYAKPLPDGSRICILNSRHDPRRIKITLMEEVAHIHLQHLPTGLTRSMDGLRMRGYDKKQEHEAYGVGAAALLPWAAFFPAINGGMAVDELAEQFEVSPQLVEYRIKITGAHALYKASSKICPGCSQGERGSAHWSNLHTTWHEKPMRLDDYAARAHQVAPLFRQGHPLAGHV